jgi:transcriptional regulator with XRE-family HTH domain
MCVKSNMTVCFSATELGAALRAERLALGKTLQWVAERVGCRRQTISELEAGKNVGVYTLFAALAALDKGVSIVDSRIEIERLKELLDED